MQDDTGILTANGFVRILMCRHKIRLVGAEPWLRPLSFRFCVFQFS